MRGVLTGVVAGIAAVAVLMLVGCGTKADQRPTPPFMSAIAALPPQAPDSDTPPADKTDGFDGKRAFAQVSKQVSFGPRPSGSPAIGQLQTYLQSELTSYGCKLDTESFTADTPIGQVPMKNIVAKIPGETSGIIMLATHYDTVAYVPNFVGADDAGSSTGVMLELARLLCSGKHQRNAVWITFFDGEEAMKQWTATDSRYGSRQMAAEMAMKGELPKVKAFLLADIVGTRNPHFRRDDLSSTKWLVDLVWGIGKKLGYGNVFLDDTEGIQDDHNPFFNRGVPCVDVIDLESYPGGNLYYWHTPQDTLDKVSSKTLAITGHVFLESLKQLQAK